ncbi:MAG: HAMP domain-containing histidine kinase [Actinobacteria bacterium]|nr:HAMP domain-containing histidine kinase [Actinomycetota bacterium]
MTLRLRLLLALVTLAATGLVIVDAVTHALLEDYLVDRVDQQLSLARLATSVALGTGMGDMMDDHGMDIPRPRRGAGQAMLPPGTYGELRSSGGETLDSVTFSYDADDDSRPDLPADIDELTDDGRRQALFTVDARGGVHSRYRVLVTPIRLGDADLIVAVPLTDVDETLARVMWIEIVVTLAALVALGATAWWLVRRELRPLDRMATTAGEIAAGDLSQRVEPAERTTEVGRLGLALNEMLAQIERAFAAQEASEQRLRRFLADASHELRTPLTSIRGYAELFRRGAGERPEDLAVSMRRIEDEARRMGVLVDDLLLLARLDADRPLAQETVDFAALVADCVRDATAAEPEQEISLAGPDTLLLTGDADRLRQVVMNLLTNAVRHTPPRTAVEVRLELDGTAAAARTEIAAAPQAGTDGRPPAGTAVLTVRDHGPGLPPAQLDRVFEAFYRVDTGRARDTGGSGLGLAIVKTVVEAHGGSVVVESAPGEGAAFLVRLPLQPTTARDAGRAPGDDEPGPGPCDTSLPASGERG